MLDSGLRLCGEPHGDLNLTAPRAACALFDHELARGFDLMISSHRLAVLHGFSLTLC